MGQTKKKKRAKQQYNPAEEIPENLRNFIDSVSIKPDENVVAQKKPKKQKEIKEDPVSKLTNRKVCIGWDDETFPFSIIFQHQLTDLEIVELWSHFKVGFPEGKLSKPQIMEVVRRVFPRWGKRSISWIRSKHEYQITSTISKLYKYLYDEWDRCFWSQSTFNLGWRKCQRDTFHLPILSNQNLIKVENTFYFCTLSGAMLTSFWGTSSASLIRIKDRERSIPETWWWLSRWPCQEQVGGYLEYKVILHE